MVPGLQESSGEVGVDRSTRTGLALGCLAVVGLLAAVGLSAGSPQEPAALRVPEPGVVAPVTPPPWTLPSPREPSTAAPPVRVQTQTLSDERETPAERPVDRPLPDADAVLHTARILGWIVDERGLPVRWAGYTRFFEGAGVSAHANAAGQFVVTDLAPGAHRFSAWRDGFVATHEQEVLVQAGQTHEVVLVLRDGCALSGVVYATDTGAPIARAQIRGWRRRLTTDLHKGWQRARGSTAVDGSFTVRGLLPGIWSFEVSATDRYLGRTLDGVVVSGDDPPVSIGLDPGAFLTGTVFDTAGTPLRGGKLHFNVDGRGVYAEIQDGAYASEVFAPGPAPLLVVVASRNRRGLLKEEVAPALEPGPHVRDLYAPQPGALAGRVVDERGAAIGAGMVSARWGGAPAREATLEAEGSFSLSGLPPGRHRLTCEAPGWVLAETLYVDVRSGEQVGELTLRMRRPAVLEVRAIGCVPRVRLRAILNDGNLDRRWNWNRERVSLEQVPGDSQLVRFEGDFQGSCAVLIAQQDRAGVATCELVFGETVHVALELQATVRVHGRVLGDLLPNSIRFDDIVHGLAMVSSAMVSNNADFSTRLLPGRYRMRAISGGVYGPWTTFTVPVGSETVEVELP